MPLLYRKESDATLNPSLARAVEVLRKYRKRDYPPNLEVVPGKFEGITPYTNQFGKWWPDELDSTKATIEINPLNLATSPDSRIQQTLAHELQHVDEYYNADKKGDWFKKKFEEFNIPYDIRPSEVRARTAANKFFKDWYSSKENSFPYPSRSIRNDFIYEWAQPMFDAIKASSRR